MGATPQPGPWTKYAPQQAAPLPAQSGSGDDSAAASATQGPWTKYAVPAANTGGVSGSWEPETLTQKVERYAKAPSEMFKGMAASDEAARQQAIQQEEARPNASPLHAAIKSLEYGVPAASARVMEGVTTPSSLGLGALATVAPELAGPVIAAEGAKSVLTPKQPSEQTPDYVERLLGGGAALAGGAAGVAEGAPRIRAAKTAIDTVRENLAERMA